MEEVWEQAFRYICVKTLIYFVSVVLYPNIQKLANKPANPSSILLFFFFYFHVIKNNVKILRHI